MWYLSSSFWLTSLSMIISCYDNLMDNHPCCCKWHYFLLLDWVAFHWEKAMAPHSSTLAWKIPWAEEPARLQSMGSLRVGHDWATSLSLFTFHFHALVKEMATQSSVLAWRIPGTGEPGGLPSMGSHRVGHDWSYWAVAAAGRLGVLRSMGWQRVRHDWATELN